MGFHEKCLVLLLRVLGCTVCLAFFAMFLPLGWMAAIHARLGLGTFPDGPIVEYLTRSLAAMYAIHGGVVLLAATDVRRYAGLIVYLAVAGVLFGIAILVIDIVSGMPAYWTVGEGPPILVIGAVILWLLRKTLAADGSRSPAPSSASL
ncbi:MAG: hypothetical protein IH986_07205 [Planctomycetes bacterium]|nr:hypothetical protein [Planctomycetota bacterium]